MQHPELIEAAAVLMPKPVLNAGEVARLLGYASAESFLNARRRLEAAGFPARLPGMRDWSWAAIARWLATNGETYLPDNPEPAATGSLERRYA